MPTKITSVVFDLGGVLIDWNPEHLYRKLIPDDAKRHAFLTQVCTRDWHERHDAGISFADNAQGLLQQYANDPHMQSLITAWGARFDEMVGPAFQGTVDILNNLNRANVPLYALTNWPREAFPAARKRFAFLSLFKDIVVSGEEGVKKPDPAIYEILLKRMAIPAASAIYIDDRQENLTPAAALGFIPILFTTPEALAVELNRHQLLSLQRCA